MERDPAWYRIRNEDLVRYTIPVDDEVLDAIKGSVIGEEELSQLRYSKNDVEYELELVIHRVGRKEPKQWKKSSSSQET